MKKLKSKSDEEPPQDERVPYDDYIKRIIKAYETNDENVDKNRVKYIKQLNNLVESDKKTSFFIVVNHVFLQIWNKDVPLYQKIIATFVYLLFLAAIVLLLLLFVWFLKSYDVF